MKEKKVHFCFFFLAVHLHETKKKTELRKCAMLPLHYYADNYWEKIKPLSQ